jgi:hypothetical protein
MNVLMASGRMGDQCGYYNRIKGGIAGLVIKIVLWSVACCCVERDKKGQTGCNQVLAIDSGYFGRVKRVAKIKSSESKNNSRGCSENKRSMWVADAVDSVA